MAENADPAEPPTRDTRPAQVRAMDLASRVISACLTPVLPPALGYWADRSWGTTPAFLIAGILFGAAAGFTQFSALLRSLNEEGPDDAGG